MVTVKHYLKTIGKVFLSVGFLMIPVVALGGDQDIAKLSEGIVSQANAIAKLMTVAAYVAGVGFALAAILQFKAHKENPQSTPLSKPVVMLVVSAALLFLPTIMEVAGGSVFGSGGKKATEFKGELK